MRNRVSAALLFTLLFTLLPGIASARVQASFGSASGSRTELVVNISQADGTLIVQEHLPPGSRVTGTTPSASKIAGSRVTWLLKRSPAGRYSFAVQLATPLRGRPSATIKYRDRASGQFIQQQVSP